MRNTSNQVEQNVLAVWYAHEISKDSNVWKRRYIWREWLEKSIALRKRPTKSILRRVLVQVVAKESRDAIV